MSLRLRLAAEMLGSAYLLAVIVGSGIMAERLAGGNAALALLANALATGAGLFALILAAGPISGAHFNPLVSMLMAARAGLPYREVPPYIACQFVGAGLGVIAAHGMFALPLFEWSASVRSGPHLLWSEFVATLGLLLVILSGRHFRPQALPAAVAAYITAAYWFTASTSFANPAVTLARAFTDSFAGIRPADVAGFMLAQAAAVALVIGGHRFLRTSQPHPLASTGDPPGLVGKKQ